MFVLYAYYYLCVCFFLLIRLVVSTGIQMLTAYDLHFIFFLFFKIYFPLALLFTQKKEPRYTNKSEKYLTFFFSSSVLISFFFFSKKKKKKILFHIICVYVILNSYLTASTINFILFIFCINSRGTLI